eukprot:m.72494 g.72494  ORF g.72494 m.72494 type:complete len:139 (-) comp16103_c0_seq1:600-1016(-)
MAKVNELYPPQNPSNAAPPPAYTQPGQDPYQGYPPVANPQQGYPPQGYAPQGQYVPAMGYQQQPQQQLAPGQTLAYTSEQESAKNERRRREKERSRCLGGMLCGGCLIALCVGKEKATNCGTKVMDTLLCMSVDCYGF